MIHVEGRVLMPDSGELTKDIRLDLRGSREETKVELFCDKV